MEHELIIGELERAEAGKAFAEPEALAQALEVRALELHVQHAVTEGRGKTAEELREVTLGSLATVDGRQEREAEEMQPAQLIEGLERLQAEEATEAPPALAHALLVKEHEIREVLAEEKPTALAA